MQRRLRLSNNGRGELIEPKILSGVLLGVDYGAKRVGLAICDPENRVAVAAGRIEGLSGKALALAIIAAARIRDAKGIVVGMPMPGKRSDDVVKGAQILCDLLVRERQSVTQWHEGYTTASALTARKHFGGKSKAGKSWIDEAAAVLILQDYLDWRRMRLTEI